MSHGRVIHNGFYAFRLRWALAASQWSEFDLFSSRNDLTQTESARDRGNCSAATDYRRNVSFAIMRFGRQSHSDERVWRRAGRRVRACAWCRYYDGLAKHYANWVIAIVHSFVSFFSMRWAKPRAMSLWRAIRPKMLNSSKSFRSSQLVFRIVFSFNSIHKRCARVWFKCIHLKLLATNRGKINTHKKRDEKNAKHKIIQFREFRRRQIAT